MGNLIGFCYSLFQKGVSDLFIGRRYKLKHILDFAVQNGTNSCKHVRIKTGDIVLAIIIYLRPLHFCFMAQLVFADSCLFYQLVELNFYSSVFVRCI